MTRNDTEKGERLVEMTVELACHDVTEPIIGASFEDFRELGYGFWERVYQKSMQVELEMRGLNAEIESKIQVRYLFNSRNNL